MSRVSYTINGPCVVFLYFVSLIIGARGDCGPPPVIENTQPVTETSGVPGQTVNYVCDRSRGYYDIPGSSKTITCQDDNMWSTIPVFCARACQVPDRLEFAEPRPGELDKDIFPAGTTVSYNCRPGLVRVPGSKNSITCLPDYTWSPPDVFCQRRSCGNPGEIANGDIEATDFLFGSTVTYTCNKGYRLTSRRNSRQCQADGTWSNALPECEAVICPAPDAPVNGSFSPQKDEYNYLDAVRFSCNKGLEVNGETSASCTSDGTWSSATPTCKVVSCPDPVVENSRVLSGFVGPYTLNSAVRYECVAGYAMKGSSSITCDINSQWVPEVPKCLTVCGTPPVLTYAELEQSSASIPHYFDGTTLQYICKPGYQRDPSKSNTRTCSGKSWSVPEMFCTLVSCGNPEVVMNSDVSAPDFLFGSRATYTCKKGYGMRSTMNSRECQADGTWSHAEIVCTGVCGPPPILTYAVPEESTDRGSNYFDGTTVRYSCKQGYRRDREKSSTLTCSGKSWSVPEVFCASLCGNPPLFTYAVPEKSSTFIPHYFDGTTLQYICKPGYQRDPSKSNTLTCSGKRWSVPEVFCTIVSCGNPEVVMNADVSAPDFLFGSRATYTCKKGYAMRSTMNSRECQADGTWSRTEIVCKAVCGTPPVLTYAEPDDSSPSIPHYFDGTTLQYGCKQGHQRDPSKSNTLTCSGKSWSVPEVFCTRVSCGKPEVVMNADVTVTQEFLFGSRATYTCMEGYKIKSAVGFRDCQADGTWSNAEIVCAVSSSGLGTGAIIGIVFAVLAVCGVIVLIYFFKKRDKRGKPEPNTLNVQYSHCND